VVYILKQILLCCAKFISDGVAVLRPQDRRGRTVDDAAILHIKAANLKQVTIISTISGQKLRHLRHRFRRVHGKSRSLAIKRLVSHPERIDVATIFVTHALVAFTFVSVTTFDAFTSQLAGLSIHTAWMRSICCCHAVGFPNVHLRTASAIFAPPHVVIFIFGIRCPINCVGFTVNEFDVVRALCIAIPSAIFGTSLVVAKALPTLLVHFDKIHSTIHTTFKVGYINVHGEFPILEVEQLVFVVIVHQI